MSVMNRVSLKMLPRYLLGLTILAVSSWLAALVFLAKPGLRNSHWFLQLLPAFSCMVVALIAHCLAKGRKGLYLFSYLINAVASGCAVGAVLGKAALPPSAGLPAAMLPAAAIGIAVCLLLAVPKPFLRRLACIGGAVAALAVIGAGVYFWACRDTLTGCALVFSGLFLMPFPVGCNAMLDKPAHRYRYLSFTGFGAFIAIAFVAALYLSEGEILDGLDFGGDSGSERKQSRRKSAK